MRFAAGYPLDDPTAAPDRGADRRGGPGGPGRRRGRGLHRAAGHRRVRGLRPHAHGPAAGPARAARRAGRGARPGCRSSRCCSTARPCAPAAGTTATAAVVECWLGGQAGGSAVADVLTGAVNPSGKLAETIPLTLADCSASLNFPGEDGHVRYGEGVFVGYRGYDASERAVAYPFGHGLSYTSFGYDELSVSRTGSVDGGDLAVTVSCRVRNTGDRAGREIVQLYVGDPEASVARPPRELKGFASITLEPGADGQVEFTLGRPRVRLLVGPGRALAGRGRRVHRRRSERPHGTSGSPRRSRSRPPRRPGRSPGCPRWRSGWPTRRASGRCAPRSAPTPTAAPPASWAAPRCSACSATSRCPHWPRSPGSGSATRSSTGSSPSAR